MALHTDELSADLLRVCLTGHRQNLIHNELSKKNAGQANELSVISAQEWRAAFDKE